MNREDKRTHQEFVNNLQYHSKKEEKYLLAWLDRHNGEFGRKKREYVVIKWGAFTNQIFSDDEPDKIADVNRPDFLLAKTKDNSFIVDWIAPLEITTTTIKPERNTILYLKKEKVERKYDRITDKIATRGQIILFIANTQDKGNEVYTLLFPKDLENLQRKQTPIPVSVFGGKLGYWFKKQDSIWRYLSKQNDSIFQLKLIRKLGGE